MRLSYIANLIGIISIYIGAVMLLPIVVALHYYEFNSIIPFVVPSIISILIGLILKYKLGCNNINDTKKTEGIFTVAFAWIIFGILASIPYLFYGFSPINALFEGISGVTTTGSSIINNYELYPKTLFFWRSLSQWLGGMGIIVLFIAVLPQFKIAGRQLFYAESPGPTEDKITPRISNTAKYLWGLYLIYTIIELIILKILGLSFFESLCLSLSTLSAGGFSPESTSLIGSSFKVLWVITLFMFIAGANFSLQYKVLSTGKIKYLFKNNEFVYYFISVIIYGTLCAIGLILINNFDIKNALTQGFFQIVSQMTSTGFVSYDYNEFNIFSKVCMFLTVLLGGCAGSAAGGIKIVRGILILKYLKTELQKIVHPQGVFLVKLDKQVVPKEIMSQIITFIIFYILIIIISGLIVTVIENNVIVGFSGVITSINNIGPGFGKIIGSTASFDQLQCATKFIFIINMLIGRLELIPFLALLQKDMWQIKLKNK